MKAVSQLSKQQEKLSAIKDYVAKDLEQINQILTDCLDPDEALIKKIGENIISAGGKRIRPILSLLTGYSLGYQDHKLYHLGAAIELIHTATLLHDDVVDESHVRRGKKTANALYDNKPAILVGDFVFAESFKEMVKTESLQVMSILSNASSIIAKGEIMQLKLVGTQNFAREYYFSVIKAKTAELFAAATYSASILASNNETIGKKFYEFGHNLGIAFQIIDDLLDFTGNKNITGKKTGADFYEGKITLPIIKLYEIAENSEKEWLEQTFLQTERNEKELQQVNKLIEKHQIVTSTKQEAESFLNSCYQFVRSEDLIKNNNYLLHLLDLTLDRVK